MLRHDIVAGTANVIEALEESGVIQALATTRQKESAGPVIAQIFGAFREYALRAEKFTDVEVVILQTLKLDHLSDPAWWGSLVAARQADDRTVSVMATYRAIDFALHHLPIIVNLLRRDTDPAPSYLKEHLEPKRVDETRLVLIIQEQNGKLSSPQRVIMALDSVTILYGAVADLFGSTSTDLALASCDSGSDKIFDFTGLAEVIEKVKDCVLSIWDRTVYYKEHKHEQRMKLVVSSLPIIEHISKLEEDLKISPEAAELFRRRIVDGATKFLDSGASTPEISRSRGCDPRLLLQANPTLLLSAPTSVAYTSDATAAFEDDDEHAEGSAETASGTDNATDGEIAEAIRQIRKRKTKSP